MSALDARPTVLVVGSVDTMKRLVEDAVLLGQNLGAAGYRFDGVSMGPIIGKLTEALADLKRYRAAAEASQVVGT